MKIKATVLQQFFFIFMLSLHKIEAFHTNVENPHFCIHTEPSPTVDKEELNPLLGKDDCEIIAVTLTAEEKENFHKTICQDLKDKHSIEHYYYFSLRNAELMGRGVHSDICQGKINPLLAWMPLKKLQRHYLNELNPTEHLNYIGKATDSVNVKSEFCHFQHADLVANTTSNLYNCIALGLQENVFPLGENIDVLIEIQPLLYELRNISYLPWSNMSLSYKTMLGQSALKNHNSHVKQIFGGLPYAFVEKIKLNLSSVYAEKLEKLPILLEYKEATLELDEQGNGGLDVKEKAYFGRVLAAHSSVKVNVVGQWAELGKQFTADIYEYFGFGIKRFREQLHHGIITFTRITSTEPVFELPETKESKHPNKMQHKHLQQQQQQTELPQLNDEEAAQVEVIADEADITDHMPYPNFYIYTIIGCLIVGAVFLLAIGSMVHTCDKERELEEQRKYKLTMTDIN